MAIICYGVGKRQTIKAYEFVRDTTPGMSEDELLFDEKEGIDYVARR